MNASEVLAVYETAANKFGLEAVVRVKGSTVQAHLEDGINIFVPFDFTESGGVTTAMLTGLLEEELSALMERNK